jgi:Zn-dependent metalloprotease
MMTVRVIILGIFLLIDGVPIEKDKDGNDFCVNKVLDNPNTIIISEEELIVVKPLFESNRIDYSNYLFYKLQTDELGYHHVRCYQFINNLKVFTNDLIFHFNQAGKYYYLSGNLITKIDLNPESSMIQNNVIKKYLNELNNDDCYTGNKEDIIKGCFDVEFVYYNLNAGISNADKNFTKAWKVKPKSKKYPFAYINDMTSNTIYYDNGIRY